MVLLSSLFTEFADSSSLFHEAKQVVYQNSRGKVWLVGGFLYRHLAHLLHNSPPPDCDLDFIVTEREPMLKLPSDWREEHNSFGNPRLVSSKCRIDLIPLNNIYSILQRGLSPTINNYFYGVPLTIQAMAYDLQEQNILGDGFWALYQKIVGVHNLKFAEDLATKQGKSVEELVKEKAESLGFTPIL